MILLALAVLATVAVLLVTALGRWADEPRAPSPRSDEPRQGAIPSASEGRGRTRSEELPEKPRLTGGKEALRPDPRGERGEEDEGEAAGGRAADGARRVEAGGERQHVTHVVLDPVGTWVGPHVAHAPLHVVLDELEGDLSADGDRRRDPRELRQRADRSVDDGEAIDEEVVRVIRHIAILAGS